MAQVLLVSWNTSETQRSPAVPVGDFFRQPPCSVLRTFSWFMAVSPVRRSMAGRLQLAAFTAVVMRLSITTLAFGHGINRVRYDGLRLQFRTLLTSHVPTKSLLSPLQPATVLHRARLLRSRGSLRPLSVSMDGVPRPHCLFALYHNMCNTN